MEKVIRFIAESLVHASPDRVFAFHELPDALVRLTPSWAGSRVIEHAPFVDVGARTVCDIRVMPLIWIRTELVHTACERPVRFVDEQVRGPFRQWRHEHLITPAENGGARLTDVVDFEPPFGMLAHLFAPLMLRRLRKLFTYRHQVTGAWCEEEIGHSEPERTPGSIA